MTNDLTAGKAVTVLLVDDHPVVRTGYRRLLESVPDIQVVGEASDGETGYALYRSCKPDVVVLDLSMSGIGGLEVIRRIKMSDKFAHILVFSMHGHAAMVQRVLKMGAEGYLTKQSSSDQLIQAVRQVRQGRLYVDPALAAEMVDGMVHNNASEDPLIVLSPREFQLFKLMAEGYSIAQIADTISISPKTVGVHHANIMRKLNLENTTQLVRLAIYCNIIAA